MRLVHGLDIVRQISYDIMYEKTRLCKQTQLNQVITTQPADVNSHETNPNQLRSYIVKVQ